MAKIYISSTTADLQKEREAAAKAVRRLNHQAVCMDDYVPLDQQSVDKCLQDVRNCDAYVGIFAWRYGSNPDGYDKSFTHLEYEAAREAKIPCLIFLVDENAPWPSKDAVPREEREKIHRLRSELLKEYDISFFKNADELCGLVSPSVSLKFPSHETCPVTMPGFRYILDRCFPRVHTWLTTRIGIFKLPPEWAALNNYLRTLRSKISDDITKKTYVTPPSKNLPDGADQIKIKRRGFLTPIQQVIKEIMGISEGGDAQNAQISALGKKSKFVRNIVKRLLKADEPLILIGDPGSGKTITLQQAAMLIAVKESKRVFPTICLFISLGEFQVPGKIDDQTVWDYVKRKTPREIRPFIDGLKDSRRLVIFFDGMDEMSRNRYNEHTKALSIFAGTAKRFTKTLFSCRVSDFTLLFKHNRLVLMPFSRSHIYQYIKQQILQFPFKIGDRDWSARQLAKQLARGGLPMQADNPFVLWLLCNYLPREREWPKSRVHLLEYYLRSYYQEKARNVEQSKVLMPDMDRTFLTLARIAYEITNRNIGTDITLNEVNSILDSEELDALQAGIKCGILQKSLDPKTTLIRLDPKTTLIRFEHHRFQEYFAAFYLYHNKPVGAAFKWLAKLDAPRWQETLFNLTLMGGGHEAISALDQAIMQGLSQLYELRTAGKTLEAASVETLAADRVELASRILQQVQQQPGDAFRVLYDAFGQAAYWLSDHGNPISKVKMMWAANIVPGIDIFRVARESLASPVSWVRQQALVITSVASRDVGGGALQEDVLHGFASGRFLNRFSGYCRIAKALKQKKLWLVLIIGLALSILQILAGFGTVAATRNLMVPLLSMQEAASNKLDEGHISAEEDKALKENDERRLTELKELRKKRFIDDASFKKFVSSVQDFFDSGWFLFAVLSVMLIFIMFTMQRAPGPYLFIGQGAGFICLLLPFIWWSIWGGYWIILLILVFFTLPSFVFILNLFNWVLTLLIQVSTLSLFLKSSCLYWTDQFREKRVLLEAMWENSGSRIVKKIAIYVGCWLLFIIFCFMFIALIFTDLKVNFAVTFGWFPFFPIPANIALSVIIYAEIIGFPVSLVFGLNQKYNRWQCSKKIFLRWTRVCLVLTMVVLLIWGLASFDLKSFVKTTFYWFPFLPLPVNIAISIILCTEIIGCLASLLELRQNRRQRSFEIFLGWTGVCLGALMFVLLLWGFSVNWKALCLLTFFPLTINVALSIAIYVEIIGFLVSLVLGLKHRRNWLQQSFDIFLGWTVVCLGIFILSLLQLGLMLGNWKAFGKFITLTFGLLPFCPPAINVALSVAIYIEIIGCLVSLVYRFNPKYDRRRRGRKMLLIWTIVCLGIVTITFVGWGIIYIVSNYLSRALGIILFLALVVTLLIILRQIIREMIPLMDSLFQFIGIRRSIGPEEYISETWKKQLGGLDPDFQASLLRRTTPETMGLKSMSSFLSVLQEVETIIEKEPALSVYWSKRNQVEQILRQEKSG